MNILTIILLLLLSIKGHSKDAITLNPRDQIVDSLRQVIASSQDPNSRCTAYNELGEILLTHSDSAINNFDRALNLAEQSLQSDIKFNEVEVRKLRVNMATSLNNL